MHTVIRADVRLAECPSFGQPITRYHPNSHGAEDHPALAQKLMKQERSR
jgi:chromosome partitioning protein